MHLDLAPSVNGGLLAAQLADLAEDAHGGVGEVLEVRRCDAGGGFRHCFCRLALVDLGLVW